MSGWTGVTMGGDPSRVTSVNLANRGLSGVIPSQFGSLPSLTTLYLHRNALTGAIPPELGNISNLKGLYIQHNQLTCDIPSQLGDPSNLTTLYILGNRLTGCIPAALRDVQNSDVGSAGLPFCASEPEPEQDSGCSNGIAIPNPDDNPGLVQDCEILLSINDQLEGDGDRLLNWSTDKYIFRWEGISPSIEAKNTVQHPDPMASHRVGVISIYPYYWNQWAPLKGGIPPQLGSLSALEELNFWRSQLTGGIPQELGNLSDLQVLALHDNQLTGGIPQELGNLSDLQVLTLSDNQLTGGIPQELGNFSNLWILHLNDNQLSSTIPQELSSLSNLYWVSLRGNQLTGCIPTALLGVHFGKIGLPYCRSDKGALTALYYRTGGKSWTNNDNWLSDRPLGEWYGVVTNADGRVTALSLRDNNLVGAIPPHLSLLDRLEVLALDGNNLSGEIPYELGKLRILTRLSLNRNDLEGPIPNSLKNLSNLSILGLARNENLSGGVPAWLGNLSNLTKLSLHDTGMSGPLPIELANLSKLERPAILNTGLCVPADDDFQTWLAGVEDKDDGKNRFE